MGFKYGAFGMGLCMLLSAASMSACTSSNDNCTAEPTCCVSNVVEMTCVGGEYVLARVDSCKHARCQADEEDIACPEEGAALCLSESLLSVCSNGLVAEYFCDDNERCHNGECRSDTCDETSSKAVCTEDGLGILSCVDGYYETMACGEGLQCLSDNAGKVSCESLCKNGRWDAGELGVDCGGACAACETCKVDTDCETGFCDSQHGFVCFKRCQSDDDCRGYENADALFCRGDGRCAPKLFVTEWAIEEDDLSLQLRHDGLGTCDFDILWGDEAEPDNFDDADHVSDCKDIEAITHTYANAGTYTVKIRGTYDGWGIPLTAHFGNCDETPDELNKELVSCKTLKSPKAIVSFGPVGLTSGALACIGNAALPSDIPDASKWQTARNTLSCAEDFNQAIDHWDLSNVEDASEFFYKASSFNQEIGHWNTAKFKNMTGMFSHALVFNQALNDWNTREVTLMGRLFEGAMAFNEAIDAWDTQNVTDMTLAFSAALNFNQPIDSWDTGNVATMHGMFLNASAFNQSLNAWSTQNVTDMSQMFKNASSFNGNIEVWDTQNVTDMSEMFSGATAFDKSIEKWKPSSVESMRAMFLDAKAYNQAMATWETSQVTDMSDMFNGATAFNGDISTWNTEAVGTMASMFKDAASFNGQINDWKTVNVTDMSHMFSGAIVFDQDLAWETQNVTNMSHMFSGAATFNGDISAWNTEAVNTMTAMFSEATLFNGKIGEWQTSNVSDMSHMFDGAESFAQDLNWNARNTTNMSYMFHKTYAFDNKVNFEDLRQVKDMSHMFEGARRFNQTLKLPETLKLVDVSYMFSNSENFNAEILLDTQTVERMTSMFESARAFNQPLAWDVQNVLYMERMFNNARNFSQDLSGWKVNSEAKLDATFTDSGLSQDLYCKLLETISWAPHKEGLGLALDCP